MLRIKDHEAALMDMLQRLINGENFTSKFAAIQLMPVVFGEFSRANQQEIMTQFNQLARDDTP